MNKKCLISSLLAVLLIITVGLILLSMSKKSETFDLDEIKRNITTCKLQNGSFGKCIKREFCHVTKYQLTERFNSEIIEDCDVDEANVICCPEKVVIYTEETGHEDETTGNPSVMNNLISEKLKFLNSKTCGVQSSNRIFNGEKADIGEFKFYVALKYSENDTIHFGCGGSLISGE